MHILASSHSPGAGQIVFLVVVVVAWIVRGVQQWWQGSRDVILEKFRKLDEQFRRRQAGLGPVDELRGLQEDEPRAPERNVPQSSPSVSMVTGRAPVSSAQPVASAPAASVEVRRNPLTEFIRQRDGLRRAMILKEVLGAPKALQMEDGHII